MSIWDDAPVISRYTRAEAIEDGVLVDVSETAREAGITWPVAVTCALWADLGDVPPARSYESREGRLWDLLTVLAFNARTRGGRELRFSFHLSLPGTRRRLYEVKSVAGPGDDPAPVITVMKPDED